MERGKMHFEINDRITLFEIRRFLLYNCKRGYIVFIFFWTASKLGFSSKPLSRDRLYILKIYNCLTLFTGRSEAK